MNNRGFTLVELLAVIVIMLSLSFVTVWGVTSALENRDKKELEEQQELAIGAAKIYFSLNENVNCVKISVLKSEGYFVKTDKVNKLDGNDNICFNNNKIEFNPSS